MPDASSLFGPGLGESQRTLLELLMRRGEATLADLEAGLDLATETLRNHLEALSAKGLVERAGVRRQGPGRPHVLYRLSTTGAELFPRREGELLRELATFLIDGGNEHLLEEFFAARVARKRELLRHRVAGLEGLERMEEVARILSEDGFVAEIDSTPDGPMLRLCHCPLKAVVTASRLPCRAEMELVRELLGEALDRKTFIPDGDPDCSYSIGGGASAREGLQEPTSSPSH